MVSAELHQLGLGRECWSGLCGIEFALSGKTLWGKKVDAERVEEQLSVIYFESAQRLLRKNDTHFYERIDLFSHVSPCHDEEENQRAETTKWNCICLQPCNRYIRP